ncbi:MULTISPECIES: decaprenyl-phosphate phosphoribosyltransferase [Methylobacter]
MNDSVKDCLISTRLQGLIALLRIKQWVKNVFVLAPLLFTGEFLNIQSVTNALLTALFFSLASSATYIINDIHDIEHDRKHPTKSKKRPLAVGVVSIRSALILLIVVLLIVLGCAGLMMPNVLQIIVFYLLLNLGYTFFLKHQPVLDIFSIAISFVLRVYAGAVALVVPVSDWMFITTLCLALYLASIKRRQELSLNGTEGRAVLQKYSIFLVNRYAEMSATGALVFYALYVMTAKPQLIGSIPVVLFGLFRYWYIADTLDGGESPTEALLSDWPLLFTIIIWVLVCGWVLWPVQG